jgi:hypothetical protein
MERVRYSDRRCSDCRYYDLNPLITAIIISLLMSPLLGHRPSLWITHKENGPYITHCVEVISSTVPGAHELQRGLVFVTRIVQLLYAPYTLVLLCCVYVIYSPLMALLLGAGLPYGVHIRGTAHSSPRGSSPDWWVINSPSP